MEIKTVLLDADGVVQKASPDWRESVAALCPEPGSREDFLAEVFAAERPEVVNHQAARANVRESFDEPLLYADVNADRYDPEPGAVEDSAKLNGMPSATVAATVLAARNATT